MRKCVMVFRLVLVQAGEVLLHGQVQLTGSCIDGCVQSHFPSLCPGAGLGSVDCDHNLMGLVLDGHCGAEREVSRSSRESIRELCVAPSAKANCLFDAARKEQSRHL